jgi:hypothetical protein
MRNTELKVMCNLHTYLAMRAWRNKVNDSLLGHTEKTILQEVCPLAYSYCVRDTTRLDGFAKRFVSYGTLHSIVRFVREWGISREFTCLIRCSKLFARVRTTKVSRPVYTPLLALA